MSPSSGPSTSASASRIDPRINCPPPTFDHAKDLPQGFYEFLLPLNREFTPRQQALTAKRALARAHQGYLPDHRPPSPATTSDWHIELPEWCQDQRNQMTGPGDDAELVVKMLNSGAPGVRLDLEDSVVNNLGAHPTGCREYSRGAARRTDLFRQDGAWTGHPDQNQIAVDQFPYPNQLHRRPANLERCPDLRPLPTSVGKKSLGGTRAAVSTVIRYRNGVLNGKGTSLLDGYMEDLATDRIYRLMIAHRMRHCDAVKILDDNGSPVRHTPKLITRLFHEELDRMQREWPQMKDAGTPETFRKARELSGGISRAANLILV